MKINIKEIVNSWERILQFSKVDHSIIIINNGSTDKTAKILNQIQDKNIKVYHQELGSTSSAIIHGYYRAINSQSTWTFLTDDKKHFTAEEFREFFNTGKKASIVLGSRNSSLNTSDKLQKWIAMKFFKTNINDPNTPFRMVKTQYLKNVMITIPLNNSQPNTFMSLISYKDEKDILEINLDNKELSEFNMNVSSIKCIANYISELLKLRLSINERVEVLKQLNTKKENHYEFSNKQAS